MWQKSASGEYMRCTSVELSVYCPSLLMTSRSCLELKRT